MKIVSTNDAQEDSVEKGKNEQLQLEIDNYQSRVEKPMPEKTVGDVLEDSEGETIDFEVGAERENKDYQLPPSHLLNEIPQNDQTNEYALIQKNVQKLEKTFKNFFQKI